MSHRFDEKKENIQKIKKDIKNTYNNIEFANDMINTISDKETKKIYKEQNERRIDAVDSMIEDIKDKILD